MCSSDLPEKDAILIVKYKNVSDFFEAASDGLKNPKTVSNFIIGQIFRSIETESEREKFEILTSPEQLHELVKLVEEGKINMNLAKKTFTKMLESGKSVSEFVSENDMKGISDEAISEFNLPTAVPYVFEFDEGLNYAGDRFLGDPDEIARLMAAVADQGRKG